MITPDSFKVRFPEFAAEDDARVQIYLDDAVVMLNEPYWGSKYDLGLAYLTAHELEISNKTQSGSKGAGGPITGQTVDGVSVTYGTAVAKDQSESYFTRTSYGQKYLSLMKSLGGAAIAI